MQKFFLLNSTKYSSVFPLSVLITRHVKPTCCWGELLCTNCVFLKIGKLSENIKIIERKFLKLALLKISIIVHGKSCVVQPLRSYADL